MRFALTDEQTALRREARRFADKHIPSSTVRRAIEGDGFDAELWRRVAELGWTALAIPEAYGGAGLGPVELALVLEETGRALAPVPLFSTLALGAEAILIGGSEAQMRAYLPAIAAGECRVALALAEADGRLEAGGVTAKVAGGVLRGHKSFVLDGHTADLLLFAARDGEGTWLWPVPASAAGLSRRALPSLDLTRRLSEVALDGVCVEARLPMPADELVPRLLDRARIALAAEQLGGAERCLELSVDYAKTREQFGRPIGSFQAVKHTLADLLMVVESARSAVWWAAWTAQVNDPELPVAARLADATAADSYHRAAADTIQVHGGIGFTWEHDAHLHFRRARASSLLFGESRTHRAWLAERIGL